MEHQTREFAFFNHSQDDWLGLLPTASPRARCQRLLTHHHESCTPQTHLQAVLRDNDDDDDDDEWGFISSHPIRCLRGSLGEFTMHLQPFPFLLKCLHQDVGLSLPGILEISQVSACAMPRCCTEGKAGTAEKRHKNKSLQTAIRKWVNYWLVFLGLLLENKSCILQSQRQLIIMLSISKIQAGGTNGTGKSPTQRGSCHGKSSSSPVLASSHTCKRLLQWLADKIHLCFPMSQKALHTF